MENLSHKNIKFFLIGFVFSLPLFWGTNVFQKNLEDFLFWGKISDNPQLLTAQIIQEDKLEQLKPIRNWQIDNLEISAKSAVSVFLNYQSRAKDEEERMFFDSQGGQKILFSKESEKTLPVASLTKLMAANVILWNYNPSQIVRINKKTMTEEEDAGNFRVGETFLAEDLLYSSLMESSNDATGALVEVVGEEAFVDLMNLTAKNLDMKNTFFVNSTGLDPDNPKDPVNYSTAEDMAKLAIYLLEKKPKIFEISTQSEIDLYSANGFFHHKIKNTDALLGEIPGIIGGKTGRTPLAQGCLLLVTKMPRSNGVTVNVVLGSSDRFGEMKKLFEWLREAYKW